MRRLTWLVITMALATALASLPASPARADFGDFRGATGHKQRQKKNASATGSGKSVVVTGKTTRYSMGNALGKRRSQPHSREQSAWQGTGGGTTPTNRAPVPFNLNCTGSDILCQPMLYLPNLPGAGGGGVPAQAAAPAQEQVDPAIVAQQAIAQMTLPDTTIKVGPPPSINEWKMAVVGYPLWLWIDTPDAQTTTVTQQGITITLNASRASTTFTMGDGTMETCETTTPWTEGVQPGTPSPTCGHTYLTPSLPKGNYTITATAHWSVDWTALGQAGTVPLDVTGAADLPVGELQSVIVDR